MCLKKKSFLASCATIVALLALLGTNEFARASPEIKIDPQLYGIGYYEQIAMTGINGASLAGGC